MEQWMFQSIAQDKGFHVALQIVGYMRGKIVWDADSRPKLHNSEARTQHSELPGR
jgi:hypothetical protein